MVLPSCCHHSFTQVELSCKDAVINLRTAISNCVCVCALAKQQIRVAAAPNSHCQYLQTMPSQDLSPACQYMGELKAAIFESLQEFGNSSIVLAKITPPGAF